jgi:hypothetical protein
MCGGWGKKGLKILSRGQRETLHFKRGIIFPRQCPLVLLVEVPLIEGTSPGSGNGVGCVLRRAEILAGALTAYDRNYFRYCRWKSSIRVKFIFKIRRVTLGRFPK